MTAPRPEPGINTPEGQIRAIGRMAQGLARPGRQRRKALRIAAATVAALVVLVVLAVVAG